MFLNSAQSVMLCAKFGWNWPGSSREEDENVKSLQTDRQTKCDKKSSLSGELKMYCKKNFFTWANITEIISFSNLWGGKIEIPIQVYCIKYTCMHIISKMWKAYKQTHIQNAIRKPTFGWAEKCIVKQNVLVKHNCPQ